LADVLKVVFHYFLLAKSELGRCLKFQLRQCVQLELFAINCIFESKPLPEAVTKSDGTSLRCTERIFIKKVSILVFTSLNNQVILFLLLPQEPAAL
jgi:hypothetical protein